MIIISIFTFIFSAMSRIRLDSNDCKQCGRVLAEIEHIDDEADNAGIKFVKIDDKQLAKHYGVFALPAILFFKMGSKEPVIYAGTNRTNSCWLDVDEATRYIEKHLTQVIYMTRSRYCNG